jgi:hypothetical protein
MGPRSHYRAAPFVPRSGRAAADRRGQGRRNAIRRLLAISAIALTSLGGCQSTTDVLNATQTAAVDTALERARFEMACPAATGSVLSRRAIDPAVHMSRFGPGGPERYEYTVGIEGCGKRQTAVVICVDGSSDCFSTGNSP